jgi:uncharacterized protein YjbI with pentapeptide repeats
MTQEKLKVVLELHKKWLNNEADGVRADLYGADLFGVDMHGVDLREANMQGVDLRGANMRGADMGGTILCGANMRGTILCGANMRGTILCGADMYGANMRGTLLYGADVYRANMRGVKNIPFIPYACPEKGEFVAFKKCGEYIIELLVPADAKRCSGTTRKCRASYAKVLSITTILGEPAKTTSVINTNHSPNVVYKVGELVYPDSFDDNRWNECSSGIHFFVNRQEAVEY